MVRLVTSLAMAAGALLIGLALLLPIVDRQLNEARVEALAADLLGQIVEAQVQYYARHEDYVYFHSSQSDFAEIARRLELTDPGRFTSSGFVFQTFPEEGRPLVARALSTAQVLKAERAPVIILTRRIATAGRPAGGVERMTFTDRRGGLL